MKAHLTNLIRLQPMQRRGSFTLAGQCATVHLMNIIILSRQESLYSTRRLVQAAQDRGHRVAVINPLSCPIEFNCLPTGLDGCRPAGQTAVIPRIGASITEFGCAVVRNYEQSGAWVLNPAVGIARSRDKLQSMQLLHGRDIPVPRTAVAGLPQGLDRAIRAVGGLPVVLKLRRGTQGKGVVLVRTLTAARRAYAMMNDFQQYTLVQEYVSEARNRDIRVIVVGQEAVAGMERQAPPGDFRANLHRGGRARSIRLDEEMKELAVRAAEVHELAFAGVDLIMTSRGPAVIEVNSSPGLQGIESATRVDVAGAVIRHVEREMTRQRPHYEQEQDRIARSPVEGRALSGRGNIPAP
jgi:ribosomal protein S6--L-glutamate ligase